jgi:hypothetical protein
MTYITMEMEKEQIMEFLQVFEKKWGAYHKRMMAMLDAHHERMMACLGQTEANEETTEKIDPRMMQSAESIRMSSVKTS